MATLNGVTMPTEAAARAALDIREIGLAHEGGRFTSRKTGMTAAVVENPVLGGMSVAGPVEAA